MKYGETKMPEKTIKMTGTLHQAVDTIIVNHDIVVIKFVWNNKPTTKRTYKLIKVE